MNDILKTVKERAEELSRYCAELSKNVEKIVKEARRQADSYGPMIEASRKELGELEERKQKARETYDKQKIELEAEFKKRYADAKRIQEVEANRVAEKEKESVKKLEEAARTLTEAKIKLSQAEDKARISEERLESARYIETKNIDEAERIKTESARLSHLDSRLTTAWKELSKSKSDHEKAQKDLSEAEKAFLSKRQNAEDNLREAEQILQKAAKKESETLKLKELLEQREAEIKVHEAKNLKDRENNQAKERNLKALEVELKSKK